MKTTFKFTDMIRNNEMFLFLMILTVGASLGFQGWRTLFNNFAVDEIGLNGFSIGGIQSFREVPGFLAFTVVFLLLFLKERHLASVSVFVMGVGVLVTGIFPSFLGLMITTFIMSVGFHYFETCNQSLALQNFNKQESPHVLASMKSANAIANISVGFFILLISEVTSFQISYIILGSVVFAFALFSFKKSPKKSIGVAQQKKMILKKRYWLFYVLNFLSGARRQIFVVFAVFLLVEKYHFSIQQVTILFVINNIIALIFNPIIARLINRFGERTTLTIEYTSLMLIFFSYAYFDTPWVAASLYILDSIVFNFSIGIRTYFQKHAAPEDIAPSMAVGFTINHIAAVILPVLGGALWLINWKIPFLGAFILSIVSLFFVQFMEPSEDKVSIFNLLRIKKKVKST